MLRLVGLGDSSTCCTSCTSCPPPRSLVQLLLPHAPPPTAAVPRGAACCPACSGEKPGTEPALVPGASSDTCTSLACCCCCCCGCCWCSDSLRSMLLLLCWLPHSLPKPKPLLRPAGLLGLLPLLRLVDPFRSLLAAAGPPPPLAVPLPPLRGAALPEKHSTGSDRPPPPPVAAPLAPAWLLPPGSCSCVLASVHALLCLLGCLLAVPSGLKQARYSRTSGSPACVGPCTSSGVGTLPAPLLSAPRSICIRCMRLVMLPLLRRRALLPCLLMGLLAPG